MLSPSSLLLLLLTAISPSAVPGFLSPTTLGLPSSLPPSSARSAEPPGSAPPSFLEKLKTSFDAELDDFMFKRMGNGEQFYGRRETRGKEDKTARGQQYNGYGLTDKTKIEAKREAVEERLRLIREREEREERDK